MTENKNAKRAARLRARAEAIESGGFRQLGSWIPAALHGRLKRQAESEGVPMTDLVVQALERYLAA